MRIRKHWWAQRSSSRYGKSRTPSHMWFEVEGRSIDGYRTSGFGMTLAEAMAEYVCQRTYGRGCEIPSHKKREAGLRR